MSFFKKRSSETEAAKRLRPTRRTIIIGLAWLVSLAVVGVMTFWLGHRKTASQYPLGYEANFIIACAKSGNSTAPGCFCSLHYVEDHYSYQRALQIDDQYNQTRKLPQDTDRAFTNCRQQYAQ